MKYLIVLCYALMGSVAFAYTCPENYEENDITIFHPNTQQSITFKCKKKNRQDYYHQLNSGEYLEASVYKLPDGKYQFNDLRNYFADGIKKRVLNYDQAGEIIREERYNRNGTITFKFVRNAGRLEIFDDQEKRLRLCQMEKHGGVIDRDERVEGMGMIEMKFSWPLDPEDENSKKINSLQIYKKGSEGKLILQMQSKTGLPTAKFNLKNETFGLGHCRLPHASKELIGSYLINDKSIVIPEDQKLSFDRAIEILKNPNNESSKQFLKTFSEDSWKQLQNQ